MMGNYEEYIKGLAAIGKAPLREVEPKAVRSHAFGNPFKTDKKSLAIDEVSFQLISDFIVSVGGRRTGS